MIVTIDGPAGAGKSTVAKRLAECLGFSYLDTGAMYRAVTLAALRAEIDLNDQAALARLLETLRLDMPPGQVLLNGEDVSNLIRTPQITKNSAPIANCRAVRTKLVEWQRGIAQGRDFVCEGRDQGTIVFPDAGAKFFLIATPQERAARRYRELLARGDSSTLQDVLRDQEARDARDAARDIAPMKPAEDAMIFDSTSLSLDEVVVRMEAVVRERILLHEKHRHEIR